MLSDLAHRLAASKDKVLAVWEERARRTVPGADRHDRPILLDGLPDVLDELGRSLAQGGPPSTNDQNSLNASHHGRQRATATDFSLDQVLAEYGLLRTVVFEVLESTAPLNVEEREGLLARLDHRVRVSAREFVAARDAERERARLSLQELNRKLEDAVRHRTQELHVRRRASRRSSRA